MPVTISIDELIRAVRGPSTANARAEITRLRGWASVEVERRAPSAPSEILDQAVAQMVQYDYDRPQAWRGTNYANVFRNSGAGRTLLPYIVRRARNVATAGDGGEPEPEPEPDPGTVAAFFWLGWTQHPTAGITIDAAEARAIVITQDDFDNAVRTDGNGPATFPPAHFVPDTINGKGFYWIAVAEGRGEPPGGSVTDGVPQGTGLTANDTSGFTDPNTGAVLEFWIWPVALAVDRVAGRTLVLDYLE